MTKPTPMSYQLTSAYGTIEAVIDDNCSLKKFYSIATMLSNDLHVQFTEKLDNTDTVDWQFVYKNHPLKLHFNIYNGVSICTTNSADNEAVNELAMLLERRYF